MKKFTQSLWDGDDEEIGRRGWNNTCYLGLKCADSVTNMRFAHLTIILLYLKAASISSAECFQQL